jgi:hypothetical protein
MEPDLVDATDAGSKKAPARDAKAEDASAIQLAMLQAFLVILPFILFMDRPWVPYAAALTCYSVLVFSLVFRDSKCSLRKPEVRGKVPALLLIHIPFVAAVYFTVGFSIRIAPQLPRLVTQAGRKGSLFDWVVTVALMMLAWGQERWMRKIISRGLSEGDEFKAQA